MCAVAMPFPGHGSEFDRAWRGLPLLYSTNNRKYPLSYVNSHHHQGTLWSSTSDAFSSYIIGVLNIMDGLSAELQCDKVVAINIHFHLQHFSFMVIELLKLMKITSENHHQDNKLKGFMDNQISRLYSMKCEVHIRILTLCETKSSEDCIFFNSYCYILEECSCKYCHHYLNVMDLIKKFTEETKFTWNFAKTRLSFQHQSELVEWHCFVPYASLRSNLVYQESSETIISYQEAVHREWISSRGIVTCPISGNQMGLDDAIHLGLIKFVSSTDLTAVLPDQSAVETSALNSVVSVTNIFQDKQRKRRKRKKRNI